MFKDEFNVIDEEMLNQFVKASVIQKTQVEKIQDARNQINEDLEDLSELNDMNATAVAKLLEEASNLVGNENNLKLSCLQVNSFTLLNDMSNFETEDERLIDIDTLPVTDDWNEYYSQIENFAALQNIKLSKDPFELLLSESDRHRILKQVKEDYTMTKANCDKYDYFLASFSGIISGFIDVFFVGSSVDGSKGSLSKFTDEQAEKIVIRFSDFIIDNDEKQNNAPIGMSSDKARGSLQYRVQYLEKKFKVSYDARYAKDLVNSNGLKMNTKNHHSVSLAHSPDLMGLLFSILDQFSNKGTYYSNGNFCKISTV